MRIRSFHLLCLVLSLVPRLDAAVTLFDFEQPADMAAWKWHSKGQSNLERTNRFATTGNWSLLFTTPAWKQGMPGWPSFETHPAVSNWTAFDRLVVDITNPDDRRSEFQVLISDSKVPFREGLSYSFMLPTRGFQRFVVPLAKFPKTVNREDIAIMHFFTQKPQQPLTLYLDNLVLLQPGEELPEPGTKFARDLATLSADALSTAEQISARNRDAVRALGGLARRVSARSNQAREAAAADAQFARLADRLKSLRTEFAAPDLTLDRLDALKAELAGLPHQAERLEAVFRFRKACREAGQRSRDMLVGVATSMEKVLPRGMPFEIRPASEVELSLARNEKESFQVLVLPGAGALKQVTVCVSDLRSSGGAVFKREHIQCAPVGYVETKSRPAYGSPHVGWWPDPILDFLGSVDIAGDDLQAFWMRVRAPKNQPPGVYRGALQIAAAGVKPVTVKLRVQVRSFALPDHSPLPLAITFSPESNAEEVPEAVRKQLAVWQQSEEFPVRAWRKHKPEWADFLADYYINYDSLYRSGPPDFDIIKRLHDRGQLVAFNLGLFDAVARDAAAARNALAGLRVAYDQAKALGVLDHAYIYGFDECTPDKFQLLEESAQTLRREFPGALLLTTSYDVSYGQDSVVKTIDAWCPLTPAFKPDRAAKARAAGKQVWWYICCAPLHPHANMFVEFPAIEGRLLMGAMTAKQRPDGFLYYQISIWNSRPVTSGPFTEWDPRSWTTYHGDGSWTCVGPDGTPLPTIRLENFRDGLEDFAYVVILEHLVREREVRTASLPVAQKQWLAEAKEALPVPESLVKSLTEYSRDPAKLYTWRNHLGDLIDRAGVPDVNPWGKDFAVRGFAGQRR